MVNAATVNVALKGVATQSSTEWYCIAQNAIDGNRESDGQKGSCTHTAYDTNPWWRVDLLDVYRVTAVTITNRGDCCSERLNGAEIRIGNSLENNGINNPRCVVISLIQAGETKTVQCNEMEGRYVVVVIPDRNEYLTLCEVEVYGTPRVPTGEFQLNVALKGVATQSSLHGDGQANNAIDGNRESNYFKLHCTHTEWDTNPWWRVDLLDVYRVTAVSITNRGDCCSERLNDAEIRIGNSLENNGINNPRCVVISNIPAGETNTLQCNEMQGRYVVVVIPGQNKVLTLCEVEVYGTPAGNHLFTFLRRKVMVVREKLCWSDALFYCREHYWDLVSVRNETEQRVLEKLVKESNLITPLTSHLWLSLRRYILGDTWYWMTGDSMNYTHWVNGVPPGKDISNPCGALTNGANGGNFLWVERLCDDHYNFLCYSGKPPDTPYMYIA
ncbi:uncharacterized protein LOC129835473 [Salvelinus fontinalis]|uniref:uncharacterized protein LOC129835473 n=1 Tax=Salvelinus fontinalis TaxID=8038 RepID=UPI00248655C5|nr:uncharacterized protein LOC129835473 [Salvelinus fontinalis]